MAIFEQFISDAQIEEIACGFIDCTMPRSSWTHSAHLAATMWLLSTRPYSEVVRDLPGLIRAYNLATGLANTDVKGYHETITQASIRGAFWFLINSPRRPLFELCNSIMRSPLGQPEWLLKYWSRSLLFSVEARSQWLEPDLKSLPYPSQPPGASQTALSMPNG